MTATGGVMMIGIGVRVLDLTRVLAGPWAAPGLPEVPLKRAPSSPRKGMLSKRGSISGLFAKLCRFLFR